MHKLQTALRNKHQLIPVVIIGIAVLFAGGVAYAVSPQSPFVATKESATTHTKSIAKTPTKTSTPTPSATITAEKVVAGVSIKQSAKQQVTPIVSPSQNQPAQTVTNTGGSTNNNQQQTNPAQNQQTAQTQSAQTQTAAATVSVELKAPDGTSSFSVDQHDGMTVCDVLQKAKDTGKLRSVTMDDSYMTTLHSRYVVEINGFANNWTFSVDGTSPLGCSLYQPKPNDTIVWKFG